MLEIPVQLVSMSLRQQPHKFGVQRRPALGAEPVGEEYQIPLESILSVCQPAIPGAAAHQSAGHRPAG